MKDVPTKRNLLNLKKKKLISVAILDFRMAILDLNEIMLFKCLLS